MTKYIVKNCPAIKPMITVDGKHGGKTMFDVCSEGKYTPCQDRTDCPIKQVAEITSAYYDIYCNHCVTKNCDGCHFDLAKEILQTLQVKEVE